MIRKTREEKEKEKRICACVPELKVNCDKIQGECANLLSDKILCMTKFVDFFKQ